MYLPTHHRHDDRVMLCPMQKVDVDVLFRSLVLDVFENAKANRIQYFLLNTRFRSQTTSTDVVLKSPPSCAACVWSRHTQTCLMSTYSLHVGNCNYPLESAQTFQCPESQCPSDLFRPINVGPLTYPLSFGVHLSGKPRLKRSHFGCCSKLPARLRL